MRLMQRRGRSTAVRSKKKTRGRSPTNARLAAERLAEAYLRWRLREGDRKLAAVLVTTGAMNPPHLDHIATLQQARDRLQQAGFAVLKGWISPSGNAYLKQKFSSTDNLLLDAALRARLRRAIAEDAKQPWIEASSWEAEASEARGRWIDFPEV